MRSFAHIIRSQAVLSIVLSLGFTSALANNNPHPSATAEYDVQPKQVKWCNSSLHTCSATYYRDTPEEACAEWNGVGGWAQSSNLDHYDNAHPAYDKDQGCWADIIDKNGQVYSTVWLQSGINATMVCPTGYNKYDDGDGPNQNSTRLDNPFGTMQCYKSVSMFVTTAPDRNPEQNGGQCPMSGNPINPINGNKYQTETDFRDSHAGNLSFTRSYNSQARNGRYWSHLYERSLDVQKPLQLPPNPQAPLVRSILYGNKPYACNLGWNTIRSQAETTLRRQATATYDATIDKCVLKVNNVKIGTLDLYTELLDNHLLAYEELIYAIREHGNAILVKRVSNVWQNPTDMPGKLTQDSTGYTWKAADDNIERYDLNGKLQSITFPSGLVHTLAYNTNGQLSTVTDSFGRHLTFEYDANGRMSAMIDPAGHRYEYAYNSTGMMNQVTYPDETPGSSTDNPTRLYHYEDSRFPANLTGITDENGVRYATWTYDAYGRANSSEHAGGVDHVGLVYNLDGTVTETNALGKQTIYNYGTLINDRRKITQIQGVAGVSCAAASKNTSYDGNGYVDTKTDWNGNVTDYTYNSAGLETQRIEAYGTANARTISTTWHATLRKPTLITEPGKTTAFTYDSTGNTLTETVTDTATGTARTTTWTYNSYGQVLTVDGPRTDVTDVTEYEYGTDGNLSLVTNALGHETQFTAYDANGNLLTLVDQNGVTTTMTYDARQRLTSRTTGTETTTFEYWPTGKLKKITQPDGSYLLYTYDNAQRLTRIDDNLGNSIRYTLDNAGNRTAENVYDPANALRQTRTRAFNGLSRLIQDIGAAGTAAVTTSYTYDNNGNPVTINAPLGRNTTNVYDSLNRLTQSTNPVSGVTQYGYNALDQLISVTDPRSKVTGYTYNALGDLKQLVSPDTGTTNYSYDSAGNLASKTDARSKTGTYSYDALNRITQLTYPDQTISYSYDQGTNGLGHLTGLTDASGSTTWSYDSHGRVSQRTQTVGSVSHTLAYSYNSAGQLQSLTLPSGNVIGYSYANGLPSGIALNGAINILTNVQYQPFGAIKGWTWGNGSASSRSYNTDGNITGIDSLKSYSYDNAFRITGITDTNPNLSQSYGYDLLDRLTSATGTGLNQTWTYDANSNRLTQGGSASSTYTVNSANNRLNSVSGSVTRSYSYDAAGNTTDDGTVTFVYNDAGRMTSATKSGVTATYALNALGQRMKKTVSGTSTYFVYDDAGHLIGEYDNAGNLIQETVWMADTPVAVLKPNGGSVSMYYLHTDHLNTPRRISRPSDNAIIWRWDSDPFGTTAPSQDPDGNTISFVYNPRFPGQIYDAETGLNYNYMRDYDPVTGRYIESDPIGLDGGLNTYSYALNNSVSNIDPDGRLTLAELGIATGGVLMAAQAAKACAETNCAQSMANAINNAVDSAVSAIKDLCNEDDNKKCENAKQKAQSIYHDLTTKRIPQFLSGGTRGRDPTHRQAITEKQSGLRNAINSVKANCKALPPELPEWERVANMPIPEI